MARSRGAEMPQRQSPRGPLHLRTKSSDSDPTHQRHVTGRSPKVGDHRSPRQVQSDPLNQKKFGTRIADLESQLGQAQGELKKLKEQLATARAAKREAQQELSEKKADKAAAADPVSIKEKPPPSEIQALNATGGALENDESLDRNVSILEPSLGDSALKKKVVSAEEREQQLELFAQKNESLEKKLAEAASEASSIRATKAELASRLGRAEEELRASRTNAAQLQENLEAAERVKEALEGEMKKLRVQTDQWRKAADAAAAVLAENGRMDERCSSTNKQFDAPAGSYANFAGSPGEGDVDSGEDGFTVAKRKGGGGMRMFGELWKKKGHK